MPGVRVDMIVRGICCVRAGVPGRTENLHVRSIVGRYLEHSRIYSFGEGENVRMYIASGDFLTRNTERRVEVGVRVDDPAIAKKLRGILDLQLRDTVNAREMQPDGTYTKVRPAEGQPPVDSQMAMFGYFQNGFEMQETDKPEKPKAESKPKGGSRKGRCKTRTPGSVRHCAPNVQVCCKACSAAGKIRRTRIMKSCVVTVNFSCDPMKVWLYLTKPTLNHWRRDVSS